MISESEVLRKLDGVLGDKNNEGDIYCYPDKVVFVTDNLVYTDELTDFLDSFAKGWEKEDNDEVTKLIMYMDIEVEGL